MDDTQRKITKIAREAAKFTVQTMKAEGIGTAEFDFIHLVRHKPGITQAEIRETLKIDKGAAARRAASLEAKGYLVRKPNPEDKRSQLLFATEKAEELKNSKASIEDAFYDWLIADLSEADRREFCRILDILYWKSKEERRADFTHVSAWTNEKLSRVPSEEMTDQKIPDKEILNKELPPKRLRKKNHRKENSHMSKQSAPPICKHPDHVTSYFSMQKGILAVITVSGLIYNLGLMARPWFEGQMIQCLFFIQKGQSHFSDMLKLASAYFIAIFTVQISRFIKRLYVRRFANNINRSMKQTYYNNLVHTDTCDLKNVNTGNAMTKALSDVDACSEGIRKFTTEIFDTGVALFSYVFMLFAYDWKLALLCLIFPPVSYVIAERMKVVVLKTGAACKESAGRLNAATLDRIQNAITYRIYGCETQRNKDYETHLADYEKASVRADLPVAALPPIYKLISMTGVLLIFYFGSKNVMGTGWTSWDIAAFSAFLSCFSRLSVKSSHAAKLFNAIQKAQVSWKRILPFMKAGKEDKPLPASSLGQVNARFLGFSYENSAPLFKDLTFQASPGEIIGITGSVACGKSTLGRIFLCEHPYTGSLTFNGKEFSSLSPDVRNSLVGYLGHEPDLLSDTIKNNVLLGDQKDLWKYLEAVCLEDEVRHMPQGEDTVTGETGLRLSGGQQKRLALARTLAHPRPILILDDPFSALDKTTEVEVFEHLRQMVPDSIIFLISHRLYLFSETDGVIWMDNGTAEFSSHKKLLKDNSAYRELYQLQTDYSVAKPTESAIERGIC